MHRIALLVLLVSVLACDTVSIDAAPLDEVECGQLHDKITETFNASLSGPDRAALDAGYLDERADLVRECLEDPTWDRAGYTCVMAATSERALKGCSAKHL